MTANYEFWLTDDAGRRITLLQDFGFASYSRSTRGYGTIQLGIPLKALTTNVPLIFQPDWRIDVWRSPDAGVPKRREGSYLLRKYRIYDREDSMRQIVFYGHSPIDILRRWSVVTATASYYQKTDYIDDMMKAVVTESFITTPRVVPAGEFSVDGDVSLGPIVSASFFGKSLLDICQDLKATSFNLNAEDSANRRIFFDVVEGPGLTNGFGYTFRTFADLRGTDRTQGVVFSPENGNLTNPEYYEDYLDQVTEAQVNVTAVQSADIYNSRWNRILKYQADLSEVVAENTATANAILSTDGVKKSINANFLSTPGSPDQPRSLYGVDWDLGDLLPVQYAGKNMSAEVEIVWVSVNENGEENIVGSNKVGVL